MTYRLEPWIAKISALVTVMLPDGTQRRYIDGSVAAYDAFEKHYVVNNISAVGGEIILSMEEVETTNTNWIGEEQTFF